jgi:hypothetical protein
MNRRLVTEAEYIEAMEWFAKTYPQRKLHTYDLRPEEFHYFYSPAAIEVFCYNWAQGTYFVYLPFYDQWMNDKRNSEHDNAKKKTPAA